MQINLPSGPVPSRNVDEAKRKTAAAAAERKAEEPPRNPAAPAPRRIDSPGEASALLALLKREMASAGFAGDHVFAGADGARVASLLDPDSPVA